MSLKESFLATVVLVVAFGTTAPAATPGESWWPHFRGPNASGTSATAKPPVRVSPTESVLWKTDVPWSPSSPVVWADRIFVTTSHGGELVTSAYHRHDGRLLWSRGVKPDRLEAFHRTDGSPAASSPAVDGAHVVSYFGSFGLLCHDLDGKELWRHPLPVAASGGQYGSGTSPLIVGERVLLNRDQDVGSSLLAVNVGTGATEWEVPRPEMTGGFATPIYWKNLGADEVVIAGSVFLKGYDLRTGAERWRVEGTSVVVCTTPVIGGDTLFAASWSPGKADSGIPSDWPAFLERFDKNKDGKVDATDFDAVGWEYTRGLDTDRDGRLTEVDLERFRNRSKRADNVLMAIRGGGKGDVTATHTRWKAGRGIPYVSSPLYYDGRVYLVKDGGMLSSYDAESGKPHFLQERLGSVGNFYASPVAADGRIYLASVAGKLSVVKAGGATPEILHQADFGERIFATPALVEDSLVLRTETKLYLFKGEAVR